MSRVPAGAARKNRERLTDEDYEVIMQIIRDHPINDTPRLAYRALFMEAEDGKYAEFAKQWDDEAFRHGPVASAVRMLNGKAKSGLNPGTTHGKPRSAAALSASAVAAAESRLKRRAEDAKAHEGAWLQALPRPQATDAPCLKTPVPRARAAPDESSEDEECVIRLGDGTVAAEDLEDYSSIYWSPAQRAAAGIDTAAAGPSTRSSTPATAEAPLLALPGPSSSSSAATARSRRTTTMRAPALDDGEEEDDADDDDADDDEDQDSDDDDTCKNAYKKHYKKRRRGVKQEPLAPLMPVRSA